MARFSSLDPTLERELVTAAQGRAREREDAFRRLFLGLREPVLGLCLQLCGTRADAEDAMQETFSSVHLGLARFRGSARLSTWVYRIAVNAALRVRSRRATRDRLEAQAPGVPDVEGPEGELALLRAMQRLSAEHRTTLALFAIEGLTQVEIAETLGLPVGTIWSRLHGARKRLAALMEEPRG
jgi:RNA polymerase sigma-70 factor (ECF subfamily)